MKGLNKIWDLSLLNEDKRLICTISENNKPEKIYKIKNVYVANSYSKIYDKQIIINEFELHNGLYYKTFQHEYKSYKKGPKWVSTEINELMTYSLSSYNDSIPEPGEGYGSDSYINFEHAFISKLIFNKRYKEKIKKELKEIEERCEKSILTYDSEVQKYKMKNPELFI